MIEVLTQRAHLNFKVYLHGESTICSGGLSREDAILCVKGNFRSKLEYRSEVNPKTF